MCFSVVVWDRNMEFSENRVPGVALGPSLPARVPTPAFPAHRALSVNLQFQLAGDTQAFAPQVLGEAPAVVWGSDS